MTVFKVVRSTRSTEFSECVCTVIVLMRLLHPILRTVVRVCFNTLFYAERLRGHSPGAPNINVSPSPFPSLNLDPVYSVPFSISTPLPLHIE